MKYFLSTPLIPKNKKGIIYEITTTKPLSRHQKTFRTFFLGHSYPSTHPEDIKKSGKSSWVCPSSQGFQKGIICRCKMTNFLSRHPKLPNPEILDILYLPYNPDGFKISCKHFLITPQVPRIPKRYHMWCTENKTKLSSWPSILMHCGMGERLRQLQCVLSHLT